jgi:hypothetical protein
MNTVMEIAEKAESIMNVTLTLDGESGFFLDNASIIGISLDGDGNFYNIHPDVAQGDDVYDLLDRVDPKELSRFGAVGLVTCGWAAPLPKDYDKEQMDSIDTPPSQHPEKRRVRLFICASRDNMASVIRFQDQDEVVVDEGEAVGPLANAVQHLMRRI